MPNLLLMAPSQPLHAGNQASASEFGGGRRGRHKHSVLAGGLRRSLLVHGQDKQGWGEGAGLEGPVLPAPPPPIPSPC